MTINMPVQTLFIQSTSKVSLNSRFTQMMNKRKPSNEEFIRPTLKSERVSFPKLASVSVKYKPLGSSIWDSTVGLSSY